VSQIEMIHDALKQLHREAEEAQRAARRMRG